MSATLTRMPSLSSRYTSRFAASRLMAERSRVNSSTAAALGRLSLRLITWRGRMSRSP